jgi:hypothetical protein
MALKFFAVRECFIKLSFVCDMYTCITSLHCFLLIVGLYTLFGCQGSCLIRLAQSTSTTSTGSMRKKRLLPSWSLMLLHHIMVKTKIL